MPYGFLADVVVVLHLAYVSYVVFGEVLILLGVILHWQWIRNAWFRMSHLLMMTIVTVETLLEIECPLTTLEAYWREQAGQEHGGVSFVGRLVQSIMFTDLWQTSWVPEACFLGFGTLVIVTFFLAPPRWKRVKATDPK